MQKPSDRNLHFDRSRYLRNVEKVYNMATADQVARGLAWYRTAHKLAGRIGALCNGDETTGAAMLAVLSPGTEWSANVDAAYIVATRDYRRPILSYGQNVKKAEAIRDGVDPVTSIGRGPKTNAFFRNILLDEEPVTVDRHAARSAFGIRILPDEAARRVGWAGWYEALESIYRVGADRRGLIPYQYQAVVWLSFRENLLGLPR